LEGELKAPEQENYRVHSWKRNPMSSKRELKQREGIEVKRNECPNLSGKHN
jgi:hypothetical protein